MPFPLAHLSCLPLQSPILGPLVSPMLFDRTAFLILLGVAIVGVVDPYVTSKAVEEARIGALGGDDHRYPSGLPFG